MKLSTDFDSANRSDYIRFLIKLLVKKYFVSVAPIAHAIGLNPTYLRDFANGARSISAERMSLIEGFIVDLYGSLLEDEIPQDDEDFKDFIIELPESLIFKEIVLK